MFIISFKNSNKVSGKKLQNYIIILCQKFRRENQNPRKSGTLLGRIRLVNLYF